MSAMGSFSAAGHALNLTQPAISARHVLFVYAGDLWICDLNGQNVRRLTSDAGAET